MQVLFQRHQPIPPQHPLARFPTLPVLGSMGDARSASAPRSRFLADDAVYTASGKTATWLALRLAGVGADSSVIVPAYHCPTMIHPILALGARPLLVPVAADLRVSLAAVEKIANAAVRAVLLPHFFGFLQPEIEAIKAWCTRRGAILIEDCAHAFYGAEGGSVLPGATGDFAIASTRKFFAASEGGALVANHQKLALDLPRPSLTDELRGAYRMLAESLRYGALGLPSTRRYRLTAVARVGPGSPEDALREAGCAPARDDEIRGAGDARHCLRSTALLIRHAPHARIAAIRQQRFRRWQEALAGLPSVEPFITDLRGCGVPYAFPVRLTRPEVQFPALKYAGVALWRWDQLAVSDDPVSRRLAVELIQLPCQHSTSDTEFERLVLQCRRALQVSPPA